MSSLRTTLALAILLTAGQAMVSCGGTTRNGAGTPGSGASSSGAASPGGSVSDGGSSLLPIPQGCAPMDAQSNGSKCAGIAGYTYRGKLCEPVVCGCAGADCDSMFSTLEACDRAHDACYAQAGLTRECSSHADCALHSRNCCPQCGEQQAQDVFAAHVDSATPLEAGLCLGQSEVCPDCASLPSPTLYPACIEGMCSVIDVRAQAVCQTSDDCYLVSKDCCECGGDFTSSGVMAVGQDYQKPARCDGVGCDGCLPPAPINTHASCDSERMVCAIIQTLL